MLLAPAFSTELVQSREKQTNKQTLLFTKMKVTKMKEQRRGKTRAQWFGALTLPYSCCKQASGKQANPSALQQFPISGYFSTLKTQPLAAPFPSLSPSPAS